jgi:hypothetical protein
MSQVDYSLVVSSVPCQEATTSCMSSCAAARKKEDMKARFEDWANTSGKRAFGLDPLVPASIWVGTKGPATSPQNGLAAQEVLVPARNEPLVPV